MDNILTFSFLAEFHFSHKKQQLHVINKYKEKFKTSFWNWGNHFLLSMHRPTWSDANLYSCCCLKHCYFKPKCYSLHNFQLIYDCPKNCTNELQNIPPNWNNMDGAKFDSHDMTVAAILKVDFKIASKRKIYIFVTDSKLQVKRDCACSHYISISPSSWRSNIMSATVCLGAALCADAALSATGSMRTRLVLHK